MFCSNNKLNVYYSATLCAMSLHSHSASGRRIVKLAPAVSKRYLKYAQSPSPYKDSARTCPKHLSVQLRICEHFCSYIPLHAHGAICISSCWLLHTWGCRRCIAWHVDRASCPCTGGSVDVASVTEASLRVATCSGALKLGKIKASTVDVDTAGESQALLMSTSHTLCPCECVGYACTSIAHTLRPWVPDECKL